ncbi:Uncharacterised protein [Raoultella terrigena]|nr:Uncharacterised protein [Raoultella terrigena]
MQTCDFGYTCNHFGYISLCTQPDNRKVFQVSAHAKTHRHADPRVD